MRFLRALLKIVVVLVLAVVVLRLTHPLPDLPGGEASAAIPASADTQLGAAILPLMARHEGLSGVVPLADGRDALAARILLARAAEESIDVQYYIWQMDTTGWLLLDELRAAAERGVRVRLLLDDNGIPGLDNVLSALDAMENVEVRIFNPFTMRSPKLLSYAFDFFRLNRRMHNKSMTVDGIATVIGGRNIGDIYFAYGEGTAYFDFDVLAVGPAAADVSDNFDAYWTSGSSYAAADVLPASEGGLEEMAAAVAEAETSARASAYAAVVAEAPVLSRVLAGEDVLEWTTVTLVSDDPAKGLGQAAEDGLLIDQLPMLIGRPERTLDLVSAYLIPGEIGTAQIEGYLADGIRTRLVTNSLEATDVPVVHSAWIGYRDRLVREGAEILELRSRPDRPEGASLLQLLTGSQSSLHAKTFAVDGERIFIGSFNFDPRSASLNTEMGFLIDSPEIATALSRALDATETFFQVSAGPDGAIIWTETIEGGEVVTFDREPNTSAFQRGMVTFMSWLPVEWIL
ncbi:phospholipase D family protein [Roseibacterium sp. SDUM158016]|uniref:phospholipase D family protein n=1 Tax=Roseicyclus sediminis TaxID=2980997 RepID=UPI0021D1F725|nr:phospholipase D family protein [Roseibacterium sp. SDUM158016]MCU4652976.1 phospholipase D family protein [Roseibacterium sp. SDUM158016]